MKNFASRLKVKMGCKCSKDQNKELEDTFSKYVVNPNTRTNTNIIENTITNENQNTQGAGRFDSPKDDDSLQGSTHIISSSSNVKFSGLPQKKVAPNAFPLPAPVQENFYTMDWSGLERETQLFNYKSLKDDFVKDPQLFCVNQLLMAIQFFKNFEKDQETIATTKKEMEIDLNQVLTESKKHVIVANNLFLTIQDSVGFKSLHNQKVLEPLYPTQFFIAHESIETNRKENFASLKSGSLQYSQIDEPIYRVCLNPLSKKLGYTRLLCVDEASRRPSDDESGGVSSSNSNFYETRSNDQNNVINVDKIAEKMSSGEEDEMEDTVSPLAGGQMSFDASKPLSRPVKKRVFEPRNSRSDPLSHVTKEINRPNSALQQKRSVDNPLTVRFQESPVASDASPLSMPVSPKPETTRILVEDNYGYAGQAEIKLNDATDKIGEPRKSGSNHSGDLVSKAVLPKQCFTTTKATLAEDSEAEQFPLSAGPDNRTYLASAPFFMNFVQNFYDLARDIGKNELSNGATFIAPRVRCREERETNDLNDFSIENQLEYLPTVEISFWPDEAIEWYTTRKRNRMRDKRTSCIFTWPSEALVMSAYQCGCHLLPLGFISPEKDSEKKGANLNFNLEWQLNFTKAEHFLLRSLNHPKLRCFLFALVIFKTHIAQLESVTEEHFKHLLFWMIEECPADWREENLGAKLIELFDRMRAHLTKEKLHNYFIRKQDMFSSVPKHKLRKAQEKFFRIKENIVPHLIMALRNLQYTEKFYAMPDLDALYEILTSENSLKLANPGLVATLSTSRVSLESSRKIVKPVILMDEFQHTQHKKREKMMEEVKRNIKYNIPLAKVVDAGRNSLSSERGINLKENITTPFSDAKKKLILEFFIRHFILMARDSNTFRNDGQNLMYVMHSENLLTLYNEIGYEGTQIYRDFRHEIQLLREVSRASTRDYWQINWGDDDSSQYGREGDTLKGRFTHPAHQNSFDSLPRTHQQQQQQQQQLHLHKAPLPKVPSESKINKNVMKEMTTENDEHDGATLDNQGKRWKRPRDVSISDAEVHVEHTVHIDIHQVCEEESTDL